MLLRAPCRFCPCPVAFLVALVVLLDVGGRVEAQPTYLDNDLLARQLKELAEKTRAIVHLDPACATVRKNQVWRLELGSGKEEERRERPALLVVAGIEGNDQAGTVSVLVWVTNLVAGYAADAKIKQLLD